MQNRNWLLLVVMPQILLTGHFWASLQPWLTLLPPSIQQYWYAWKSFSWTKNCVSNWIVPLPFFSTEIYLNLNSLLCAKRNVLTNFNHSEKVLFKHLIWNRKYSTYIVSHTVFLLLSPLLCHSLKTIGKQRCFSLAEWKWGKLSSFGNLSHFAWLLQYVLIRVSQLYCNSP